MTPTWPRNPSAYAKAISAAVLGAVLVTAGHLAHDATLAGMGYGALAAALAVLGIPNKR